MSNIWKKAGVLKKHQNTTYPIIKPVTNKKTKVKPVKLEGDTEDVPGIDTKADFDTPPAVKDEKVNTYSLKTTTFGLKKQTLKKRLHSYRCPTCKEQFRRLALLNDHYKNTHSPILCEDCTKEFGTLSTLERHVYLHKLLDYTCTICEKQFPFTSDLETRSVMLRLKLIIVHKKL